MRRCRGAALDVPRVVSRFARHDLLGRYGMIETTDAIRRKDE